MREGAGEGEERNGTSKAATKSREVLPSFLPSRAERCIHRAHEEEEEEGEERNGSLAGSKDMARSFLLRGDRPRKCSARVSGPRLEGNCFEAEGKRKRERDCEQRSRSRASSRASSPGWWFLEYGPTPDGFVSARRNWKPRFNGPPTLCTRLVGPGRPLVAPDFWQIHRDRLSVSLLSSGTRLFLRVRSCFSKQFVTWPTVCLSITVLSLSSVYILDLSSYLFISPSRLFRVRRRDRLAGLRFRSEGIFSTVALLPTVFDISWNNEVQLQERK